MDFSKSMDSLEPAKSQDPRAEPKKICNVCHAPAKKVCSACDLTYYCSVEHQKQDWKEHKKNCPQVKLVNSDDFGYHLVATRKLRKGILIHIESALLQRHASPQIYSCSVCSAFTENKCGGYKCPWLICGNPNCTLIHSTECKYARRIPYNVDCIEVSYEKLYLLRGLLLKTKCPEVWEEMLKLNERVPSQIDQHNVRRYFESQTNEELARQLTSELGLGVSQNALTGEDVFQMESLMGYKGILYDREYRDESTRSPREVLYLKASHFRTECFPNCSKIIRTPQFTINIWTALPIEKGQPLTIASDGVLPYGLIEKRVLDAAKGKPYCKCPRCVDPTGTELGSMISALKCQKRNCKDGFLLPAPPFEEQLIWMCNQPKCLGEMKFSEVQALTNELEGDIRDWGAKNREGFILGERTLRKKIEKYLHPSHRLSLRFLNHCARDFNLDCLIGRKDYILRGQPAADLFRDLDQHFRELRAILAVVKITDPGVSYERDSLLEMMVFAFEARWIESVNDPRIRLTPQFCQEAIKITKECWVNIQMFPQHPRHSSEDFKRKLGQLENIVTIFERELLEFK